MAKTIPNQTALLPVGQHIGLVTSVSRGVTTSAGKQDIFKMAVPKFSGYDIVIFNPNTDPSPFLDDVSTGSVVTFDTVHRSKVDPQTGKEATRAFNNPVPDEAAVVAAIAAALGKTK